MFGSRSNRTVKAAAGSVSGASAGIVFHDAATPGEIDLVAVFVLALWLACLVVGGLGLILPENRPLAPPPRPAPFIADQLQVELTPDQKPPPETPPIPLDPLAPPPPADALAPPPIAEPIAVARPTPAIAFALPVDGATRVVSARRAEYANRPSASAVASPAPARPPVQALKFGEGEGRQPAPEYPAEAVQHGEEGIVVIRLTVAADGRVASAEAVTPCPWQTLNLAAVRAVRQRWHFPTGAERIYEVAIRFSIAK